MVVFGHLVEDRIGGRVRVDMVGMCLVVMTLEVADREVIVLFNAKKRCSK